MDHQVMTSADLEAVNTLKKPMTVAPKAGSGAKVTEGRMTARLPRNSYQMIRLALG
jgi:alpha-L-arabinofuranosidase